MRGQSLGAARLGAGALVAGLLGVFGLVAASPAAATVTATINSPPNKAAYQTYQDLSVDATVNYGSGDSGTATLTATDPDYTNDNSTGCAFTVGQSAYGGSAGGTYSADVAGPLDLSAAYPKSCASDIQGRPAVNGTWKITLSTTSGTSVTNTFTSSVPPAAPTGVKGSSGAPLTVTVTWAPNPEADTHAYSILNGSGGIVSGPTDATSICSATSCSASFTVSQSGSQSFSVRAYRYTAPPAKATSATVGDLTADSAAQTVTVQAKSTAASPTPSPTSDTGSGGGTSPTATKSSTPAPSSSPQPGSASSPGTVSSAGATPTAATSVRPGSSAAATTGTTGASGSGGVINLHNTASSGEAAKISAQFQNFAAPAGIDKLPPLPKLNATTGSVAGLAPATAADDGEPTDDGTFKPTLGYAPETKTVVTHTVTAGAPLSFVADAIGISPDALWRSLAGSLVLILCAGHVRRWARQPIE